MNYLKLYNSLIDHASNRNWSRKNATEYVEQHHIIPRSLGGNNKKENLVFLTAREHFLAHWLLFKIHTGENKSKMANAFFRMCQINEFQHRSSRFYSIARKAFSDYNPFKSSEVIAIVKDRMTKCNPMKDPAISKKVSDALKGKFAGDKNPFYGQTHSKETLIKISSNNHYTKKPGYKKPPMSDEQKAAISRKNKGRKRPDLSQIRKDIAPWWIVSLPSGEVITIKNLFQWAAENNIPAHWLYNNRKGYKAKRL